MSDKRKQRIRKLAAELGIGYQTAAELITKRAVCVPACPCPCHTATENPGPHLPVCRWADPNFDPDRK